MTNLYIYEAHGLHKYQQFHSSTILIKSFIDSNSAYKSQRVINLFIISITYHLNHNKHAENKRKNEQFLCKNVDKNQIINTTTLGNCTQSRGRNTQQIQGFPLYSAFDLLTPELIIFLWNKEKRSLIYIKVQTTIVLS